MMKAEKILLAVGRSNWPLFCDWEFGHHVSHKEETVDVDEESVDKFCQIYKLGKYREQTRRRRDKR